MNLTERDQKALKLLAIALVVTGVIYFWPEGGNEAMAATALDPAMAEQRLDRTRKLYIQLRDRQANQKQALADLKSREQGLIVADTAAQAQAQLFQIVRRLGRAQSPAIDIRANEFPQPKGFSPDYAEVFVSVSFEAGVEQVVNLLSDLPNQPELLATSEVRLSNARDKDKIMPVRLVVSGLVPRSLVPEKKGPGF